LFMYALGRDLQLQVPAESSAALGLAVSGFRNVDGPSHVSASPPPRPVPSVAASATSAAPPAARRNDSASLAGLASAAGGWSGEARSSLRQVSRQTGTTVPRRDRARGSGRGMGPPDDGLRDEYAAHGAAPSSRPGPARAGTAITDQDVDREHAAQQPGLGLPSRDRRHRRPRGGPATAPARGRRAAPALQRV
jgi:hypothetical protein